MAWTNISSSRTDADSPIDEDLVTDIVNNTEYNHDHAIRSGTHTTGARTAMARGRTNEFVWSSTRRGPVTITYSTADDGDPNFSDVPRVYPVLVASASGGNWENMAPNLNAAINIRKNNPTQTTCDVWVDFGDTITDIRGYVEWLAIGLVSSGE